MVLRSHEVLKLKIKKKKQNIHTQMNKQTNKQTTNLS